MKKRLLYMDFKYPDYNGNSIYNLSCLLSESLGIETEGKPVDLNLEKKKTILILMDGFGINYVKKLNINQNHKVITSVFPSTTASVLTTLFTAKTPGEHGVMGYVNYVNDLGLIMPMRYTFSGLDINDVLTNLKNFNDEFYVDSYLKKTVKKVISILPGRMEKSVFTNQINGRDYLSYKIILSRGYSTARFVLCGIDHTGIYLLPDICINTIYRRLCNE